MRSIVSMATFVIMVSLQANASELNLACHPSSSSTPYESFLRVDRILIDTNQQKIEMTASSTGDYWRYENGIHNDKLDWFDKIAMYRFKDGVIMAAGIRAKATYSFSYQPNLNKLVFSLIDEQKSGSIIYNCRQI